MVVETTTNQAIKQVLMLSLYGSKGRLIEAYMCPTTVRLKVRYSNFFEFRRLNQAWVDTFVRWFLSEPLAEPSRSKLDEPQLHEGDSDAIDDVELSASETEFSDPDCYPDLDWE